MSHLEALHLDLDKAVNWKPVEFDPGFRRLLWYFTWVGIFTFGIGLVAFRANYALFWGAFYTNLLYWMGLSVGAVVTALIMHIVRASWAPTVKRVAEASVSFFWVAWLLLVGTYFGKEHLFYWARHPMPGREWWMEPDFVYVRHALCLGVLFLLLYNFVRQGLRGDLGILRERSRNKDLWNLSHYTDLIGKWRGEAVEKPAIDIARSRWAPPLVMAYAIFYSLFAFEMVMGMDPIFYANMFGAFVFVGNVLGGWAILSLSVLCIRSQNPEYASCVGRQQFHDLGKLTFGFVILWCYLFFSQFLPIWYGNMPEETQWLILRIRENPWRLLSWATIAMCFFVPFILLLSEDVKKTPLAYALVCVIILIGLWCERYVLIMPQISPHRIPIGPLEIGFFLGFLGTYGLCVTSFLKKYPILPYSDPVLEEATAHA